MKCNNCGFEHEQDFEYCVNCGAKVEKENFVPVEPVSLNPAEDVVLPALKDNLFLTLCILMSAMCALSFTASGLPLLMVLITIFMWLAYADAKKGFANEKHLQVVSGAVYANYIITNVLSVLIVGVGVLIGVMFKSIINDPDIMLELELLFNELGIGEFEITQEIANVIGWAMGAFFVVFGILMFVFNVLMVRKIHQFLKSVYMGVMYQNTEFKKPMAVRNWMIFYAVCGGIMVATYVTSASFVGILQGACAMGIGIMASKLVKKYFI